VSDVEKIAALCCDEAAETHHVVYRIVDGDDPRRRSRGMPKGFQGCYADRTDGNPSREIPASRSSFGGFESCDLGPQ